MDTQHEPITAPEGGKFRARCSCGWDKGVAFTNEADARLTAGVHAHQAEHGKGRYSGSGADLLAREGGTR